MVSVCSSPDLPLTDTMSAGNAVGKNCGRRRGGACRSPQPLNCLTPDGVYPLASVQSTLAQSLSGAGPAAAPAGSSPAVGST